MASSLAKAFSDTRNPPSMAARTHRDVFNARDPETCGAGVAAAPAPIAAQTPCRRRRVSDGLTGVVVRCELLVWRHRCMVGRCRFC